MKLVKILLILLLLSACSQSGGKSYPTASDTSPSPTQDEIKMPIASGEKVGGDKLIQVDYSHTDQGYVMVKTLRTDHERLKVKIIKGEVEYPYDLEIDNEYVTLPLSLGSGSYTIKGYENIEGTRYTVLFSFNLDVQLENETISFLYPSQIVNYTKESEAVAKSFELTQGKQTQLERVLSIYKFIVEEVEYDWDKVEEVKEKYVLPIVDQTLATKKGICFDYAALMSTMLRVQQIPTRLLTGYVDEGYHSWVEVYLENEGWINPKIFFEKQQWKRVDPTYDASGQKYTGSYQDRYIY